MWLFDLLKWLAEAPFMLIGVIITYWPIAIVISIIIIVLIVIVLKRV